MSCSIIRGVACPEELSPHALYMRLKRLCEMTATGKLNVSQEVHEQYTTGNREELALALVLALKTHGFGDGKKTRELVRAEFAQQMVRVKEVSKLREEEVEGGWYTIERMQKELSYSKALREKMVAYCTRFKSVLTRKFKYDESQLEYFIETATTVKVKRSELEQLRMQEAMEEVSASVNLGQLHCRQRRASRTRRRRLAWMSCSRKGHRWGTSSCRSLRLESCRSQRLQQSLRRA